MHRVLSVSLLLLIAGCVDSGTLGTEDSGTPEIHTPGTTDTAPPDTEPPERVGGVEEPGIGEAFFDETSVPTIGLLLPDSSTEALRADPRTYVPATFLHDGNILEPVGVRTKGNGSWQSIDDKPSLKIKFDEYDEELRYQKMSEVTLNNMTSDYSMMHERIAYRVFRDLGVAASRAHHTWVELNGESYGLYTHIESATKDLIKPWFDDSGTLWELHGGEFEAAYIDGFQQKFGPDDRSPLEAAAAALEGDQAFDVALVEQVIDLDDYLNFWAVSIWTAHYDGYPYRYPGDDAYTYYDPESGLLKFLPHGVDESFYYSDWVPTDNVTSRLGWKCLVTPQCAQRLYTRVHEVSDEIEALDYGPWIAQVRAQIATLTVADTNKAYTDQYVAYYQDFLVDMVANRKSQLEGLVPAP